MRCERCGVELTNKIIKINDVAYCENCARLMGYGKFLRSPEEMLGSAFSPFDEIASTIMQMSDLDFGNSALSCPKCGMTLRDFEKKGRLGCIECYNTFNDYIVKEMFKQQGNSEYAGRIPAQSADTDAKTEDVPQIKKIAKPNPDASKAEAPKADAKESAPAAAKKNSKDGLTLDQLMKADLGMLSDEELEKGIKVAADAEEYKLASRLRDELKGRKDGGNNG
jgi:protein-arginine kinase activator protein McsA